MIQMKEQIINILREHPGLQKREIASYLRCHHFKIITLLNEMEQAGEVVTVYHHEPEQMEFYDKYYLPEDVLDNGMTAVDPDE